MACPNASAQEAGTPDAEVTPDQTRSPLERWREIDDAAAASCRDLTSLQIKYSDSWVTGPADDPVHEVYNEVHYIEQGDCYRMRMVSSQIRHRQVGPMEPHDWIRGETDQAYDGRSLWMQLESGGRLLSSTKRDAWPLLTPLPWDTIRAHSRIGTESAIAGGRLRCASVEEVEDVEGRALIKVEFHYVEAERVAIRLWYDPALGHSLVRAEGYSDESGALTSVMRDVVVHTIETEDAVYYLPTAGSVNGSAPTANATATANWK